MAAALLSHPQGYYPSPPDLNSPLATTSMQSPLASNEPYIPPVLSPTIVHQGPAIPDPLDTWSNPSIGTQSQSQPLLEPQSSTTVVPPIAHQNVQPSYDTVIQPHPVPPIIPANGGASGMGTEEFTEDDWNFFDVLKPAEEHVPMLGPTAGPGGITGLQAVSELEEVPPLGDIFDFPQHSDGNIPSSDEIVHQLDVVDNPNTLADDAAEVSRLLEEVPPLSPAATPEELSNPPLQLDESHTPPPPRAPSPPQYPYPCKEPQPKMFDAVPFPLSLTTIEEKYTTPGSKFCKPRLPPSPSPSASSEEEMDSNEEFLPEETKLEVERQRALKREKARLNKVEIWHSTRFRDVFRTETDPRIYRLSRVRGLKRDPRWLGKSYLRSKEDRDPRGNLGKLGEYVDLVDESDTAASEEDEMDSSECGDGSDDDTETLTAQDQISALPPSALPSRAGTPTPADLPPGPSLLHTLFHPSVLIPYSTPFSSGLSPSSQATHQPPHSVPTPVSPNTNHTQPSESTVMLESAAQVALSEIVENPTWAEFFKAIFGWVSSDLIWPTDIAVISEFLQSVPLVQSKLKLQNFASDKAKSASDLILPSPKSTMVAIGQGNSVLHLNSTSIRFWEKLGLTPAAGPKDVLAFALYDEAETTDDHKKILSRWLHRVADVYSSRGLGTHYVGDHSTPYADGLVPFRWESLRTVLGTLCGTLPEEATHIVIYLVSNPALTVTSSPAFRQLSTIISRRKSHFANKNKFDSRVTFHLVPKDIVYEPRTFPTSRHLGLETFVMSVYDRLLRKVERIVPRKLFKQNAVPLERFVQVPAFSLVREPTTYSFILMDWPVVNADVADRHTQLHVGYQLSTCLSWLFICSIDEKGQTFKTKTHYLRPSASEKTDVYSKVADLVTSFFLEFTGLCDIEWSIVISRLGTMSEAELIAWQKCLHREFSEQNSAMHVTVTCTELDASLALLPPLYSEAKELGFQAPQYYKGPFHDSSSTSHIVLPVEPLPCFAPKEDRYGVNRFELDMHQLPLNSSLSSPPSFSTRLRPLATACIISVPAGSDYSINAVVGSDDYQTTVTAIRLQVLHTCRSSTSSFRKSIHTIRLEVAKSYQDLAVLTKERWGLVRFGGLPFHLAAVETMRIGLDYIWRK